MSKVQVQFETERNTIGGGCVAAVPRVGERIVLGYQSYTVVRVTHYPDAPYQPVRITVEPL